MLRGFVRREACQNRDCVPQSRCKVLEGERIRIQGLEITNPFSASLRIHDALHCAAGNCLDNLDQVPHMAVCDVGCDTQSEGACARVQQAPS